MASALASCGKASSPAGDAPVALELGLPTDVTSFANADVAVAEAQGFFRAAGLAVHVKNLSSGVTVVQGVVGGSLNVGAASIEPVVNAQARGGGLAIIGSYADRLTVSMVTPVTIQTPADLRGKRLGIQQVGAFREVMTRMVLEGAGLTPADATYVPVSANGYASALIQGTIQSAILQTEQAIDALQRDDKLHVLVDLGQIRPDYFYGTYVVSQGWLARNQDVARRFLTAIVRAHRFMYQDKAGTVPIVARATGLSEPAIGRAYDVLLGQQGVFSVNAGLDPARITRTVQTMQQFKILTGAAPSESSLVDRGPISAVIRELGPWTGDPRWH
ncbi:MAG: ABC transporter substrate-binding protein [Deltaproteobacteria bacterium]|nr:MAG: ABC transporter substrate-binding protein [Deltaproteobacteria bacterium]